MTVIAGVIEGGNVWMGGDSAMSDMDTHELITVSNQKVFRTGPLLMGVSGSARVGDVLRYSLTVPKPQRRVETSRYMRTTLIDALRETFRRAGLFRLHEEEEVDSHILVGYRGRLFIIEEDMHIHEAADTYAAIGTGAGPALGALTVTPGVQPRKRLLAAMRAAERYTVSVRGPFYVLSLDDTLTKKTTAKGTVAP